VADVSLARVALLGARPYISAAVNAGGGRQAARVLQLVDQALKEYADAENPPVPKASSLEQPWEPPGGWPPEV
jgi:hypothetical protein